MKILLIMVFLVGCQPSHIKEFEQNQMIDGCVMQKSNNQWIKTCG